MFDNTFDSYINEIQYNLPLTYEEEQDLKNQILNGSRKAKNELYERHLKFVVSVAKKYKNNFLELSDLISEGNYGMLVALEKFDYTKDVRFMTYAVYWIRHYINKALTDDSRTIRIPSNIVNEKDATEDDMPITCISINPYTNLDESGEFDILGEEIFNMNELIGDFDIVSKSSVINYLLSVLNSKEKEIITLYYGIGELGNRNLSEIGEILGLTKERVRQIKVTAIRKVKSKLMTLDMSIFE